MMKSPTLVNIVSCVWTTSEMHTPDFLTLMSVYQSVKMILMSFKIGSKRFFD